MSFLVWGSSARISLSDTRILAQNTVTGHLHLVIKLSRRFLEEFCSFFFFFFKGRVRHFLSNFSQFSVLILFVFKHGTCVVSIKEF